MKVTNQKRMNKSNEQIKYRMRGERERERKKRKRRRRRFFLLLSSHSKMIDDEGVSSLAILIYDLKKKRKPSIYTFDYITHLYGCIITPFRFFLLLLWRTNHATVYMSKIHSLSLTEVITSNPIEYWPREKIYFFSRRFFRLKSSDQDG